MFKEAKDKKEYLSSLMCACKIIFGKQARIIKQDDETLILAKPMEDGSLAVGMFNLAENPQTLTVKWDELGINVDQRLIDVWRQKDIGVYNNQYDVQVARHGVMFLRMWPI